MKKLYIVELKGLTINSSGGKAFGKSYVVAENPNDAYKTVKEYLDKIEYGYSGDRELHSITQIAETDQYGNLGMMLFLSL